MGKSLFSWRSLFGGCLAQVENVQSPDSSAAKKEDVKKKRTDRMSLSFLNFSNSTISPADLSSSLVGSNLQMFSLAEVKSMCQNRTNTNYLGEGGFGPVYKGFIDEKVKPGSGLKGQAVAVKSLDLEGMQGHKEWLTEVILLGQMRHPHLVRLIGYCYEKEHRMLVYEYMVKGSLENHLFRRHHGTLPWSKRIKIAVGAAKGLAFLHREDQQIIYRDVKASNILLDSNFEAKLSDFGLAKDGPEGDDTHVSTRVMGTEGYAAPEYIMTGHLTLKSDVYSFGVVLLELLTGRRPFDEKRPAREQNLLDWAKSSLNDPRRLARIMDPKLEGQYSSEGIRRTASLAYKCLSHLPKHRPNMSEIVEILEPLENLKDTFVFNVVDEISPRKNENGRPIAPQSPRDKRPDQKPHVNARRDRARAPKYASYSDTSLHKKSPRQQRSW